MQRMISAIDGSKSSTLSLTRLEVIVLSSTLHKEHRRRDKIMASSGALMTSCQRVNTQKEILTSRARSISSRV